jgi:hypothetical protein
METGTRGRTGDSLNRIHLRIDYKPLYVFLSLAAVTGSICFFISRYHHRPVRSRRDLIALLPRQNRAVFFLDLASLRQTGVLKSLRSAAQEAEYQDFVRETHFDYTQDLDELAGSAGQNEILLVVRGRFDWRLLRNYAALHGGKCDGELCRVPTSQPQRWASFWPLQPDAMVLVLGPPVGATEKLQPHYTDVTEPDSPVWIEFSPALLPEATLPEILRLFTAALQPASSVTFSLFPAGADENAFEIRLNARCASPAAAQALAHQLQLNTKLLTLALTRKGQNIDPASLAGLLTSGKFYASREQVLGIWPVTQAFLRAIE